MTWITDAFAGIASGIGEDINPSVALLDRHVRSLMMDLEDQYLSIKTPRVQCHAAQGGLATLVLWLGWLRSFETFPLLWRDFDVVEPPDGPSVDLPLGCGAIPLCLGPEMPNSIVYYLLLRNRKHFGQAQGTPFTEPPLLYPD
jgi:hypothetical protein